MTKANQWILAACTAYLGLFALAVALRSEEPGRTPTQRAEDARILVECAGMIDDVKRIGLVTSLQFDTNNFVMVVDRRLWDRFPYESKQGVVGCANRIATGGSPDPSAVGIVLDKMDHRQLGHFGAFSQYVAD